MHKIQFTPLLCCCVFFWSCAQQSGKIQNQHNSAGNNQILRDEIAETSGLVCLPNGHFLTINDSGNPAVVFRLDTLGQTIGRTAIDARNQDWEALTLHQGRLWIADIGNNSGQRTSVQLYHSAIPGIATDTTTVETITLRYPPPLPQNNASYQHELDAEALVSTGQQLLIFSKNWTGDKSRVYEVDTGKTSSTLLQVGETSELPGLITDIAFSAQHQVFVVVGYRNFYLNPLQFMLTGDFSPFLAILDRQYQLVKTMPIATNGQLEAVCLDDKLNIWLSQEKSPNHPAKLWRWGALPPHLHNTK